MALGLPPNTSTVPRKRRPRAVGEVFISSSSQLYLVDRHEQGLNGLVPVPKGAIEEPFYENTAPDESVISGGTVDSGGSGSGPPLVDPKGRVLYLSVVRVRQPPENPDQNGPDQNGTGNCSRPDVPPRRKNRLRTGLESGPSFECQVVSAFVGELWDVYVI